MTAVSSAALADQVRKDIAVVRAVLVGEGYKTDDFDRLVALLDSERQARENSERGRDEKGADSWTVYKKQLGRAEAAEAECDRLMKVLREIAEPRPKDEGDWGATYDWHESSITRRDIARRALAAAGSGGNTEDTT